MEANSMKNKEQKERGKEKPEQEKDKRNQEIHDLQTNFLEAQEGGLFN